MGETATHPLHPRAAAKAGRRRAVSAWSVLKQSAKDFGEDEAAGLAAAIAFYGVLSLAPLLVALVSVAGWVWGDAAPQGHLVGQLRAVVGPEAAETVGGILERASGSKTAGLAGWLSFGLVLFSATLIVVQLQKALNAIWDVKQKKEGVVGLLRARLLALTVIGGTGLLLVVLVAASTVLNAILGQVEGVIPGPAWLWSLMSFLISSALFVPLFAAVFKVVPNVRIQWRHAWFGAVVTAVLFAVGKEAIAWYLGRSSKTEMFGAAGSLILLLLWIYYSAMIVFFGAELTQVRAQRAGERIEPDEHACRVVQTLEEA